MDQDRKAALRQPTIILREIAEAIGAPVETIRTRDKRNLFPYLKEERVQGDRGTPGAVSARIALAHILYDELFRYVGGQVAQFAVRHFFLPPNQGTYQREGGTLFPQRKDFDITGENPKWDRPLTLLFVEKGARDLQYAGVTWFFPEMTETASRLVVNVQACADRVPHFDAFDFVDHEFEGPAVSPPMADMSAAPFKHEA